MEFDLHLQKKKTKYLAESIRITITLDITYEVKIVEKLLM